MDATWTCHGRIANKHEDIAVPSGEPCPLCGVKRDHVETPIPFERLLEEAHALGIDTTGYNSSEGSVEILKQRIMDKQAEAGEELEAETNTPIDRFLIVHDEQAMRQAYTASREEGDLRESGLLRDYAFNRKSFEPDLTPVMGPQDNGHVDVGADDIEVVLWQGIDEAALKRTLSGAINATIGIDPLDPPEEADWEEMLKGGLQTALETQVIVFAVRGVSRACTHQLVRSRRAAFHQQSMRAHYYGDRPEFRMPESVWRDQTARSAFIEALLKCHYAYWIATEQDISYQDARYILPEGTTNFILLEYPIREFLNVYAYRACSMFQWEIVSVMRKAREALIAEHAWMEPYVKISCEKTRGSLDGHSGSLDPEVSAHHCTFQGWEEVEGQCDFPYARETNRAFKSDHHTIKRGAKNA